MTLLGHFLASAPKPLSVGTFNHTIGVSANQQGIKCMLVLSAVSVTLHLRQTPATSHIKPSPKVTTEHPIQGPMRACEGTLTN